MSPGGATGPGLAALGDVAAGLMTTAGDDKPSLEEFRRPIHVTPARAQRIVRR